MEDPDDKVPPLFGVPANHAKSRVQARFLKSTKRSSLKSRVSIARFAPTCPVFRRLVWLARPKATQFPSG